MISKRERSLIGKLWETAYTHLVDRFSVRAESDKPFRSNVADFGEFASTIGMVTGETNDLRVNPDYNIGLNTDWCWKAFDIRSSEIPKYDWDLIHVVNENTKNIVETHPGIDLFYDVNDEYTEVDLWKMMQLSYDVIGEAPWYVVTDPIFNKPISIIPLLPDMGKFYVYRNEFGKITGYELRPKMSAVPIKFTTYEIFFYRCFDLSSSERGLGLMNKIIRLTNIDRKLKEYMESFLENFGSASIHMSVDKALTDEEYKDAKIRFQQEWGGSRKYRKPIVTDLGATINEIGQTVKELDFANSDNSIRDQIIAIAGTPRYLYGFQGAINKADVEGQRIAWLENTVFPLLDIRDARFSQDFWNKYYPQTDGKGGKLQMVSKKPKLDDKVTEIDIARKQFGMGLMTVDQMCELQGLPRVGGAAGRQRFIDSNLKPVDGQTEPKN